MLKRVIPAKGRRVFDIDGLEITRPKVVDVSSNYYRRRIEAGDLVMHKIKKEPTDGGKSE